MTSSSSNQFRPFPVPVPDPKTKDPPVPVPVPEKVTKYLVCTSLITTQFDKEIDCILADRTIRKRGIPKYKEYLISLKGEEENETSWEKEDALWQFGDDIRVYNEDTTGTS